MSHDPTDDHELGVNPGIPWTAGRDLDKTATSFNRPASRPHLNATLGSGS